MVPEQVPDTVPHPMPLRVLLSQILMRGVVSKNSGVSSGILERVFARGALAQPRQKLHEYLTADILDFLAMPPAAEPERNNLPYQRDQLVFKLAGKCLLRLLTAHPNIDIVS